MATAVSTRGTLTPNASLPAKVQSIPPNQTLYVTNLPSAKIQKDDLRTALYLLFSTHGTVLDVVALKTMKMRGQAHIVYRDVQASTQAMRHLDGRMFLGRKLKIEYARGKSHFVAKLDGTFKMPSVSGAATVEQTDLQRSIFDAPTAGSAPADGPSSKAAKAADEVMKDAEATEPRGQKRTRDEEEAEESEEEDVEMEEDSDDDE
ncbi:hypothetical protein DCS_05617 [Drechmeria coniospora]|uniref:RRM domain-containing protein n=1 Tax=Drechmeria coniospora TaxID=98403 RepID=A0A151GND1_DRECN|nr:hypothetical protein DCS_05617 [Drechmeria coniospora]KYK58600.1 hypothetical protein DCS_05617 [Drechmeria coniospora]ODA83963.1 hypothetical protein RJ55_02481 [Drechmeria coniospora]